MPGFLEPGTGLTATGAARISEVKVTSSETRAAPVVQAGNGCQFAGAIPFSSAAICSASRLE